MADDNVRQASGRAAATLRSPLTAGQATEFARTLKAVADPVRLRLLSLIACSRDGETCVCDVTEVFDLSGPTISHHLKVLREAGLVMCERRGTWVYYRVMEPALEQLAEVLRPSGADGAVAYPGSPEPLFARAGDL